MALARVAALVAGLALAGPAYPQCTKDTDCKGDRICEKGICVAPPDAKPAIAPMTPPAGKPVPQSAAPVGQGTVPATGDFSPERLGRGLEDALKCNRNPEPNVAFSVLSATGFIALEKPKVVMDGMPVYGVNKPLSVFGFKVLEVTGFDPSTSKYRGPGTSTPLNLAVVVEGDIAAVKAEFARNGGKVDSVNKPIYSKYPRGSAEVTCFGR